MDIGNSEWEWWVGAINGYGECGWEQKGNKIRHITILAGIGQMGGINFSKTTSFLAMVDGEHAEVEIDPSHIILKNKPKEGIVKDWVNFWGGAKIIRPGFGGRG